MTKTALISVSDKTGLTRLGTSLEGLGWRILASGGTARALSEAGIAVEAISGVTGFPEILGGRVKTLHPKIHGGILARRDQPGDMGELDDFDIPSIDLVVVNLYPFEQAWKDGLTPPDMVENIDIGGVALLRAAAKNSDHVLVAVEPAQYEGLISRLEKGEVDREFRRELAAGAFRHTAYYDSLIAWYLSRSGDVPPAPLTVPLAAQEPLKYGENPHQKAALYRYPWGGGGDLAFSEKLRGPDLSYNNYQDAQAAWELASELPQPACVAVKHATPCGVALGGTAAEAFGGARDADPVSIFGGIVAFNCTVDQEAASATQDVMLDVLVAPDFTSEALEILSQKRRLKILRTKAGASGDGWPGGSYRLASVGGGLLLQEADPGISDAADWRTVTQRQPTEAEISDMRFALTVVKHVRSNAIVMAQAGATTGIGGGQVNRVEACRLAARQAGERAVGSVLASDAFFPFADTLEVAASAGVTAVIQPGGSVRDEESIQAADRHGMAMVFTGRRHFKH